MARKKEIEADKFHLPPFWSSLPVFASRLSSGQDLGQKQQVPWQRFSFLSFPCRSIPFPFQFAFPAHFRRLTQRPTQYALAFSWANGKRVVALWVNGRNGLWQDVAGRVSGVLALTNMCDSQQTHSYLHQHTPTLLQERGHTQQIRYIFPFAFLLLGRPAMIMREFCIRWLEHSLLIWKRNEMEAVSGHKKWIDNDIDDATIWFDRNPSRRQHGVNKAARWLSFTDLMAWPRTSVAPNGSKGYRVLSIRSGIPYVIIPLSPRKQSIIIHLVINIRLSKILSSTTNCGPCLLLFAFGISTSALIKGHLIRLGRATHRFVTAVQGIISE